MRTPRRGWIFYDGECNFCTGTASRFDHLMDKNGFVFTPLQEQWVRERLNSQEIPNEMILLLITGEKYGGADAFIHLSRFIWWAWPLYILSKVPGSKLLFKKIYQWIAVRRYCIGGTCRLSFPQIPAPCRKWQHAEFSVSLEEAKRWEPKTYHTDIPYQDSIVNRAVEFIQNYECFPPLRMNAIVCTQDKKIRLLDLLMRP